MLSRKILQTGLRRHIKLTTSVRGAAEWDDTEPQAHDAQHLQSPFHDGGARADYMTGSDARTVGYSGEFGLKQFRKFEEKFRLGDVVRQLHG